MNYIQVVRHRLLQQLTISISKYFQECWWDHWILDVVVCNGGGIWLGMIVGQFLELRRYRWESVLEIDSRKKKFKRCLLQFTPESWGRMDWIHGNYRHPIGRTLALFIIMMLWQIVELNTFFSKHFFRYPGKLVDFLQP